MRLVPALLCGGLALSGCASPATAPLPEALAVVRPATLTPAQVAIIHKAVLVRLKDPESARFGPAVAGFGPTGTLHVCGEVNSKNSYGGYVGMTTYSGEFAGLEFRPEGPAPLLASICEKQGLLPPPG